MGTRFHTAEEFMHKQKRQGRMNHVMPERVRNISVKSCFRGREREICLYTWLVYIHMYLSTVHWKSLEAVTPQSNQLTYYTGVCLEISSFNRKKQGSLKKWLILRLGQGTYKMKLWSGSKKYTKAKKKLWGYVNKTQKLTKNVSSEQS